jgi:SfnB family sulfur acquisition oxidoreductase
MSKHPTADLLRTDAEALDRAKTLALEFAAGALERDRDRRLPYPEIEQYSASGLWGITVPSEYGGAGVSTATLVETMATISAADSSIGQIPQNHFATLEAIRLTASEDQKRFLFGEALKGKRFGNAAAEIGGKIGTLSTRLTRDGEGWRLNGKKFYATGALFADWVNVIAFNEQDQALMAFLPSDAEGLEIIDDWSGMGQRTTGSGTALLDNVAVPDAMVLPYYQAYERPTNLGAFAQILHSAILAGIARAAFSDTVAFVRNRSRPFPDAGVEHAYEDPLLIQEFGRTVALHHAAEALLFRAADIVDKSSAAPSAEAMALASIAVAEAKAMVTESSLAITNKLFELAGTSATLEKHGLDRHWRNARTHTLHDPVRWKYQAIGNYYLNGVAPARRSYI